MDYDPSRDWDRYNDEMERQAMEEFVGLIHELARDIYVSSNPSASGIPEARAQQAYEAAFELERAKLDIDVSIRQFYSVKKLAPEDKNWSDNMMSRYADLMP